MKQTIGHSARGYSVASPPSDNKNSTVETGFVEHQVILTIGFFERNFIALINYFVFILYFYRFFLTRVILTYRFILTICGVINSNFISTGKPLTAAPLKYDNLRDTAQNHSPE